MPFLVSLFVNLDLSFVKTPLYLYNLFLMLFLLFLVSFHALLLCSVNKNHSVMLLYIIFSDGVGNAAVDVGIVMLLPVVSVSFNEIFYLARTYIQTVFPCVQDNGVAEL